MQNPFGFLKHDNHVNYLAISFPTPQKVNYNSNKKNWIFIRVIVTYFENYVENSIQCERKRAKYLKLTEGCIEINYCNLRNCTLKTIWLVYILSHSISFVCLQNAFLSNKYFLSYTRNKKKKNITRISAVFSIENIYFSKVSSNLILTLNLIIVKKSQKNIKIYLGKKVYVT